MSLRIAAAVARSYNLFTAAVVTRKLLSTTAHKRYHSKMTFSLHILSETIFPANVCLVSIIFF